MIDYEGSADLRYLIKLWPIFNTDELSYTFNSEIIFEFELPLFIQFIKIEFAGLQILKQKVTVRRPLEKATQRLVKHFLNYLEFILRTLFEIVFVNAPVFQLHF